MSTARRAADGAVPRPSLLMGALGIGLLGISLAQEPPGGNGVAPAHFQEGGARSNLSPPLPGTPSGPAHGGEPAEDPGEGKEPSDEYPSPAHLDRGAEAPFAFRVQARVTERPPAGAGSSPPKAPVADQTAQEESSTRSPFRLGPREGGLPPRFHQSHCFLARAPPFPIASLRS